MHTRLFILLLFLSASLMAQLPGKIKLKSATDNKEFNLAIEKGKFVALHFLLKTECPYCIRHTQDYFKNKSIFAATVFLF